MCSASDGGPLLSLMFACCVSKCVRLRVCEFSNEGKPTSNSFVFNIMCHIHMARMQHRERLKFIVYLLMLLPFVLVGFICRTLETFMIIVIGAIGLHIYAPKFQFERTAVDMCTAPRST